MRELLRVYRCACERVLTLLRSSMLLLCVAALPSGSFFGNIAIVPYQKKSGGSYKCTTCAPITSKATANWNGDSFSLVVNGKHITCMCTCVCVCACVRAYICLSATHSLTPLLTP